MIHCEDAIGVFDSGMGGVSVLRQLRKLMPREQFLYFGDCENAPYGTKSAETVQELTLRACEYLFSQNIKALVIACNTATAAAIGLAREKWPDRIIVGIEPALKLAADRFPGGRIGVMATPLTLREEKFAQLSTQLSASHEITPIPVMGLVELVEAGRAEDGEAEALLKALLTPYVGKLDALVLGCTHYPFASNVIAGIMGESTTLISGGEGAARQTKKRLQQAGLLRTGGEGGVTFLLDSQHTRLAESLLRAQIPEEL